MAVELVLGFDTVSPATILSAEAVPVFGLATNAEVTVVLCSALTLLPLAPTPVPDPEAALGMTLEVFSSAGLYMNHSVN